VIEQLRAIEASTGDGTLRLPDGISLDVTSLGKPYFPTAGLTKGDLLRYYAWAAPLLLPRLADRPLVLRRHPRGAAGPSFFQQNAPASVPEGVRVETIVNDEGEEQRRFVGGNLATLLYLVQLGTISMDAWHERVGSFGVADYGVLDLDPGKGVPFAAVVEVACALRDVLEAAGRPASLKTSGKRGLHVYLPLPAGTAEEEALALAKGLAEQVVARLPRRATIERSVRARPKRSVYVDYLQNIRAKPVAAPYCVRATPEATVSTPLRWEELTDDLDPKAFTIETVPGRVAEIGDVWGI
jgi:bifunctional non-homologous end joining protein LigD